MTIGATSTQPRRRSSHGIYTCLRCAKPSVRQPFVRQTSVRPVSCASVVCTCASIVCTCASSVCTCVHGVCTCVHGLYAGNCCTDARCLLLPSLGACSHSTHIIAIHHGSCQVVFCNNVELGRFIKQWAVQVTNRASLTD